MGRETSPTGRGKPEFSYPHYQIDDVSSADAATGSGVGMIGGWLETETQTLLQGLVSITGDLGQVNAIIEDLNYLMQMLENLSVASFVSPSNYGKQILAQLAKCMAAVEQLQGSPGSGVSEIKSQLMADLMDELDLFKVCSFTEAFQSLANDPSGLLNCLYECIHDSNTTFSDNKGSITSAFENYYWAVQTDIDNLNTMVSQLDSEFGSVPTAVQTLDTAVNTFWSDLNGIEVSGEEFHNEYTSLYDEMRGNGPIGNPISWYLGDLNKACNGDKHYSATGAATAYSEGVSVLNHDILAAEQTSLPPNELVDILHETLTTPLGSSTICQQELQSFMDAYLPDDHRGSNGARYGLPVGVEQFDHLGLEYSRHAQSCA